MIKTIKEKIIVGYDWTKRNVKKVLIGLGIVGVATAITIPLIQPDLRYKNLPNVEKIPEQALYSITYHKSQTLFYFINCNICKYSTCNR